jgi:RNase P subunit RPR2
MIDFIVHPERSMDQTDRYEIFLKRSMDCEALARSATDTSIREKCAELALAYRALASQMRLLLPSRTGRRERATRRKSGARRGRPVGRMKEDIPIETCPRCNSILIPKSVRSSLLRHSEVELICPKCDTHVVEPLEPRREERS